MSNEIRNKKLESVVAIYGDSRLKHWAQVDQLAFSPDGALVTTLSRSGDHGVALWDGTSGALKRVLRFDSTNRPSTLRFSPDGKTIGVSALSERRVILVDEKRRGN